MDHLLYLVHRIPYPPNKGDKIRSYHVLRYLCRHFRVHLGCFIDDPDDRQHMAHLDTLCASTCFIDQHRLAARLRSLGALFSSQAMSLPYYRDGALRRWVDATLRENTIGRALVFSGPMAQYLTALPPPQAAGLLRVVDFVDVDSEKWQAYAAGKRWPMAALYRREARRLLGWERAVAQQCDGATFVSPAEAALFRLRAPQAGKKIDYFNNGVDSAYFSPHLAHANPYAQEQQEHGGGPVLVFTGAMDYWPNVEAVCWFCARVLPALRRADPALRFYIVGARPAAPVRALARQAGVHVTGAVPDVRPYLAHAALAVAPLRIARGVQNKVLEAMAMEKAVVASPQALEGISALVGREVLSAPDEHAFIHHIAALLATTPGTGIGTAARRRVLQDYDWDSNLARLAPLLGLAPQPAPGTALMEPQ